MENSVKRLSKKDILNGVNNVEYIYFTELGGELPLRSLTDGQWTRIEAIRTKGTKMSGNPSVKPNMSMDDVSMGLDLDIEALTLSDFDADCLALTFGIADGEVWTVDEVKQLKPAGIVSKIAEQIYGLSGVKPSKYKGGTVDPAQFR